MYPFHLLLYKLSCILLQFLDTYPLFAKVRFTILISQPQKKWKDEEKCISITNQCRVYKDLLYKLLSDSFSYLKICSYFPFSINGIPGLSWSCPILSLVNFPLQHFPSSYYPFPEILSPKQSKILDVFLSQYFLPLLTFWKFLPIIFHFSPVSIWFWSTKLGFIVCFIWSSNAGYVFIFRYILPI